MTSAHLPLVLLVLLLVLLSSVTLTLCDDGSASAPSSDTSVVTLTDANFNSLTKEGSWMLEFYAPWCGHCKSLAPAWERAAAEMKGKINYGKVDCTVEKTSAARFGVKGYPTIKFMRDGKARAYNGGRSVNDLLSFSKQMTAAPVIVHSSPPPIAQILTAQPSVFLLLSPSSSPSPAAAAYERVAYSQQGMAAFHHLHSAPPAFLASLSLPASLDQPVLLHFSRGMKDNEGEQYTGDWDDAELSHWIADRLLPLVSTLDQSNFDLLTSNERMLALVVTKDAAVEPQLMAALLPLAKESRDKMLFATADGAKYGKFLAQFMEVEADKLPALVVFSVYPDSLHRPDEQPQSVSSMVRAVREIRDGQRSPSNSLQWYQPTRYVRMVERFLRQFSDMQIVALVVAITVTLMGLITWCCFPPAQPSTGSSSGSSGNTALRQAEQAVSSGVKAAGKQMMGAVEVAGRQLDAEVKRVIGGGAAKAEAKTAAELEEEEAEAEEAARRDTEIDEVTSDEHENDDDEEEEEEEEQTQPPAAVQRKRQATTTTQSAK